MEDEDTSIRTGPRLVLPITYKPNEFDVIFGPSKSFQLHWPGNKRFVKWIRDYLCSTNASPNGKKRILAVDVLEAVRKNRGDFLLMTADGRFQMLDERLTFLVANKVLTGIERQRLSEAQRRQQAQSKTGAKRLIVGDQQEGGNRRTGVSSPAATPCISSQKQRQPAPKSISQLLPKNCKATELDVIFGPGSTFDKDWPGNTHFLEQILVFRRSDSASQDTAKSFMSDLLRQVKDRGGCCLLLTAKGTLLNLSRKLFQTVFVAALQTQLAPDKKCNHRELATAPKLQQKYPKYEARSQRSELPTLVESGSAVETGSTPKGTNQTSHETPGKAAVNTPDQQGAAGSVKPVPLVPDETGSSINPHNPVSSDKADYLEDIASAGSVGQQQAGGGSVSGDRLTSTFMHHHHQQDSRTKKEESCSEQNEKGSLESLDNVRMQKEGVKNPTKQLTQKEEVRLETDRPDELERGTEGMNVSKKRKGAAFVTEEFVHQESSAMEGQRDTPRCDKKQQKKRRRGTWKLTSAQRARRKGVYIW